MVEDLQASNATAAPADAREANAVRETKPPALESKGGFDGFVERVRRVTPAFIVNNSSQLNLGSRAIADAMSMWSGLRKGSQSYPRFIAGGVALFAEILGVFYTEKEEDPALQARYQKASWPEYIWMKTRQAFDPKNHIMQTIGFTTVLNGVLTTVSGVNQSSRGKWSYESIQGAMTVLAGLVISYLPNRERAWQLASTIFFTRAPPSAMQAYQAYYHGYPDKNIAKGDWQQGAKFVLNQLANTIGVFYGGVKKLPDGTIVHIHAKVHNPLPDTSFSPPNAVADTAPGIVVREVAYDASPKPALQPNPTAQAGFVERVQAVSDVPSAAQVTS